MADRPDWLLDQCRYERSTEILMPLVEGIGPVWSHSEDRGGWYGYVGCAVQLPDVMADGMLTSCEHVHGGDEGQEDAWRCAERLAAEMVEAIVGRRVPS